MAWRVVDLEALGLELVEQRQRQAAVEGLVLAEQRHRQVLEAAVRRRQADAGVAAVLSRRLHAVAELDVLAGEHQIRS